MVNTDFQKLPPSVLVVDDEPDFGAYVGLVAQYLGYSVELLSNPKDFQSNYQKHRPDVIVLDVVMPELTGLQLVEWLVDQKNEARVVLVTGYNPHFAEAAKVFAHAKGRFPVEVLTKPMGIQELSAAISGDRALEKASLA
ncbi:MAG: response regulator [Pseudomonadota bacterium]